MADQNFNITDPIFDWAQRMPYAAAIIEGNELVHYGRLCIAVRRAAQQFRDAGIRPGDTVGVSIRGTGALHMVTSLALARIGAAQVTLSPNEPVAARLALAQSLGVKAVASDDEDDRLGGIPHLSAESEWLSVDHPDPVPADMRITGGDNTWIVVQSSGTTAAPKNIGNSHRFHRMVAERFDPVFAVMPGERVMSLSGFRFRIGISRALHCLSRGGTFVIAPVNFTPAQLLQWIDVCHVTYLSCVPLHLHALLEGANDDFPRLPGIRILRCSGAPLSVAVLQSIRKRIAPNLYVDYGANEAGGIAAASPAMLDRFPESTGLPLPGVELEIVGNDRRPVPAGTVGHVRVRGAGIGLSVLLDGADEKPTTLADGWFYPGDTALLNQEGMLFLKGRSDEVMNFDGILIGPLEIEAVLSRHPAVAEAAAFALPSPQHQDVPAVAVVLKMPIPMEDLHRYCAEHLGIRAPREYFVMNAIPKSGIGKVLRRRLVELALVHIKTRARPV